MLGIGRHWVAAVISAGAIAGLTTVIRVLYFGLTRIFPAMSRDGLLPPVFLIWMAIGLSVYFSYSRWHSALAAES